MTASLLTGAGNETSAVNTASTTVTVSKPANVADGDLLLAYGLNRNQTTVMTATGWTAVTPSGGDVVNSGLPEFLWLKVPSASAISGTASWVFTSGGGASGRMAVRIHRITGADIAASSPIDVVGVETDGPSGTTIMTVAGVTTTAASELVLTGLTAHLSSGAASNFGFTTTDTITSKVFTGPTTASTSTIQIASFTQSTAAATGTRDYTPEGTTSADYGYMIAIKSASTLTQVIATRSTTWAVDSLTKVNVLDLDSVGSAQNKVSGTTLAVTASKDIPAGALLVCAITCDNFASTTAPTMSLSNSGGVAWTSQFNAVGSGVTTTAGAGIWHRVFTVRTTAAITSGSTITTITFGTAVVAKAAEIDGYTNLTNTLRGTVATATSTTGAPSVATTGTALVTGDLVVGTIGTEDAVVPTGDSDTLNGSWDAISGISTTGSTAATNVAAAIQDKVVTATGVQTYNPTGASADAVASVFGLVPETLTRITATRDTTWNVAAGLTQVIATRATTWTAAATVTQTKATTWTALAPVAVASRATTWAVRSVVASTTRATTWAVFQSVQPTRATLWAVQQRVTQTKATTWNVAFAVAATTRATTWAVLSPVTAASRVTTWAVRFAVAPTTRATTWSVLSPVAATARATTWAVLSTTTQTKASTWAVAQTVTATRATLWNVDALGSVGASRGTTWTVRAAVTQTKGTVWAVAQTVTQTRATTWSVLTPVTPASRATTWSVRQQVTPTRATTWNVAVSVQPTRATTWSVLSSTTATRATTWSVRSAVTASQSTTWTVLVKVTPTRATTWSVLSPVAAATRATTWAVKATVVTSRATLWNVNGNLVTITVTRATTWGVIGRIVPTRTTTWDTKAVIGQTRATTWNVKTTAAAARATTWGVAVTAAASRATTWQIRQAVTPSRSTTWNTREAVVTPRYTQWDVAAAIPVARATTWKVNGEITTARATTWQVRQRVTAEASTTWAVESDAPQRDLELVAVLQPFRYRMGLVEDDRFSATLVPEHYEMEVHA